MIAVDKNRIITMHFTIILFRFCSDLIFIFACIYISVFIFSPTYFLSSFDLDSVFNPISIHIHM